MVGWTGLTRVRGRRIAVVSGVAEKGASRAPFAKAWRPGSDTRWVRGGPGALSSHGRIREQGSPLMAVWSQRGFAAGCRRVRTTPCHGVSDLSGTSRDYVGSRLPPTYSLAGIGQGGTSPCRQAKRSRPRCMPPPWPR